MNIRQMLLTSATLMLLAAGNAWSDRGDKGPSWENQEPSRIEKEERETYKAPEIDAKAGTSAIALLTGVLLLIGERSRSRRS